MAVAAKRRGLPTSNKTAKLPPSRKSSRAGGTASGQTATSTSRGSGTVADRKSQPSNNSHGSGSAAGPPAKTATTTTSSSHASATAMERMRLDSTMMARGMTARHIGARVASQITILTKEEVEKDLRHMEAFANTCVAYAQQFFSYHNRGFNGDAPVVTSDEAAAIAVTSASSSAGAAAAATTTTTTTIASSSSPTPPTLASSSSAVFTASPQTTATVAPPPPPRALLTLPVRIDPEEEKRLAQLRKKIAFAEAQREVLETQYMSLRAHNVEEWQRLEQARTRMEYQLSFLRSLVQAKGKVLHLQRVRVQMARDILACLYARQELLKGSSLTEFDPAKLSTTNTVRYHSKNDDDTEEDLDLIEIWNRVEDDLRAAEVQCCQLEFSLPTPTTTSPTSNNNNNNSAANKPTKGSNKRQQQQQQRVNHDDEKILPWQSLTMPRTPQGVPLLVSQLSLVADRCVAYSTNGVLGAKSTSLCWLESNLPKTIEPLQAEKAEVEQLREEFQKLQTELQCEQSTNQELQRGIRLRRQKLDQLCIQMTVLRSETESVLARHNILLDTHQARAASKALHTQVLQERRRAAAQAAVAMTSLADMAAAAASNSNDFTPEASALAITADSRLAVAKAHPLEHVSSGSSSGDAIGAHAGAAGVSNGATDTVIRTAKETGNMISTSSMQSHHEDDENDGDDEACDEEEESEIMDDVPGQAAGAVVNHAPANSRHGSFMPHEVVVNSNRKHSEMEDLEGKWSGKRSLESARPHQQAGGGASEEDAATSLAAMGGRKRRKV